jgi:ferric-dicitrate binding protein FerR (iron transport regulator)
METPMFYSASRDQDRDREAFERKWTGLWDMLRSRMAESGPAQRWLARAARLRRREAVFGFSLGKGQTLAFEGLAHFELRCESGVAMATCEGDSRDHLLRPGVKLFLEKPGKVVISAHNQDARCCVRWP